MIKLHIYLFSLLFSILILIPGCSDNDSVTTRIGPSDKKVELDFKDWLAKAQIRRAYRNQPLYTVKTFKVTHVNPLSEDRINYDFELISQIQGGPDESARGTLSYRLNEHNVWVLQSHLKLANK